MCSGPDRPGERLVGEGDDAIHLAQPRVAVVGGGFVEHEHGVVGQQGPCQAHPGALTAGDPGVPLADPAVEAVGQSVQPRTEARPAQCRFSSLPSRQATVSHEKPALVSVS